MCKKCSTGTQIGIISLITVIILATIFGVLYHNQNKHFNSLFQAQNTQNAQNGPNTAAVKQPMKPATFLSPSDTIHIHTSDVTIVSANEKSTGWIVKVISLYRQKDKFYDRADCYVSKASNDYKTGKELISITNGAAWEKPGKYKKNN